MARPITGVRDSGGKGMKIRSLLSSFELVNGIDDANEMIRGGRVQLSNQYIKDVLFDVVPGTYTIKIDGTVRAEVVLI
jgi:hypothetical protein